MSNPYKHMRTMLSHRYGADIGTFLAKRVARAIRRTKAHDQCLDNIRVADVDIAEELEHYEKMRAVGCCGFFDAEITHYKSGRHFRYGFNYGH